MTRRQMVFGGAAAVAALAGVAAGAWWRGRSAVSDETQHLWSLSFEQPDGGRLALAAMRGRPLLLNFWATWCPPCVTEMPLLDAFQRQQPATGFRVVGLAADHAQPVRDFLQHRPVGFAIGLAGLEGIDLSRRLGNPAGGLPFSVVFDAAGRLTGRKTGALSGSDLQRWDSDRKIPSSD